tara:strand:+ start:3903 stop:5678 length:1776 start_codon:yes stop_codon:yes gene_type:complete
MFITSFSIKLKLKTKTNIKYNPMSDFINKTLMQKYFYKNVIDNVETITDYISNGSSTMLLSALCQSGKADTMILASYSLLYDEKINKCFIINGMSDTYLRNQMERDIDAVFEKFQKYVMCVHIRKSRLEERIINDLEDGPDKEEAIMKFEEDIDNIRDEIQNKLSKIKGKIKYVACRNLNKVDFEKNDEKILVIHDESDYGQTEKQTPGKFLKRAGIYPNKKHQNNGKYYLTFSATPFAESINAIMYDNKEVIIMKPGEGYIGIKELYENNCIKFYRDRDMDETLEYIIENEEENKGAAIIRCNTRNTHDKIIRICKDKGKSFIEFDSTSTKETYLDDIINDHDVVIVKNFLRRGQRVNKKNIRCFVETSINAKSDTLIQSFLGRAAGYKNNEEHNATLDIQIYIPDGKGKYKEYIRKYIDSEIPDNARNVRSLKIKKSKSSDKYFDSIPDRIEIAIPDTYERDAGDLKRIFAEHVLSDEFVSKNEDISNLKNILNEQDPTNIRLSDLNSSTYKDFETKLEYHFKNDIPMVNPGTSCGVGDQDIRVWHKMDIKKLSPDYPFVAYIQCRTVKQNVKSLLPKTDGKEIFSVEQ